MLIAVDVQYAELAAVTAVVGFDDWADPTATLECVDRTDVTPEPYQPGAFYRRELPFLLDALGPVRRRHPIEAVIIDAHVWLRPGQPGLGARLHQALGGQIAVVGVAKSAFIEGCAIPVLRGDSGRPLFVTAAGLDADRAAELVRGMHGRHRVPTLLKRADRLARGRATPDPAKAPVT